jgi:arylsulfatase A
MKRFIGSVLILSTVSFLMFSSCQRHKSKETKTPNVILIMADDLGYETITANGGASYQTPEIDKMAGEGIRFEHCYAQPLCTPSRVQIMTGIYNVRNYIRFGLLDTTQVTFGHLFKKAGYATCIVGKWQLGKDPMSPHNAGFDEFCMWQISAGRIDSTGRDTRFSKPVLEINGELKTYGENDYGPQIVSDYGMNFIERSVDNKKSFFLYYPMVLTHCPFSPTPDSPEWMKDDTTVMKYKGEAHYFEDMMAYTDKIIGNINQKLTELGIADNTIVLFTGDNGTDLPIMSIMGGQEIAGAKGQSTDAGTRVPLIVKWPAQIKPGSMCNDLIDFSDVLPTLCEVAQIKIPDSLDLDGQSFLPQLIGSTGEPREWVYNWYSRSGELEKARVFARNHQYKLYESGEFYEIPKDYLEENPLDVEGLSAEINEIHSMLSEVLEKYRNRRLESIP